jgi:hypothetical protein
MNASTVESSPVQTSDVGGIAMGSVVAAGVGVVAALVPVVAAGAGAAGAVTTGVVTVLVLGSKPPSRPPELLSPRIEAVGSSASVVAGDIRSANSDRAAASAASKAIVTRLRRRSSGDRNGLVDGEGFI